MVFAIKVCKHDIIFTTTHQMSGQIFWAVNALTYPSILEEALEYAAESAILVASSGNQGLPTCDSKYTSCGNYYPAAYPYVTGVMSYGKQHQLSSFSNWDFQSGSEPKAAYRRASATSAAWKLP